MKKIIIVFAIIAAFLFLNAFHEEYPDEFDSMLGGRYITEGKVIYKDWFQHHQPGAYVLASFIYPFSGESFVRFRIGLAAVYCLYFFVSYLVLKRRTTFQITFYPIFLLILAITMTYFWGQMLLADTLAAYVFIPGITLLLVKTFSGEKFNLRDLTLVSVSTFLVWFTSMTYTYLVVVANCYLIWLFIKNNWVSFRKSNQLMLKAGSILIIPYVLFFTYFGLTGALKDYYFANVVYNQNYYIYNYPRQPGAPINPIRYAVIISNDFINNYTPLINGVLAFPLGEPFRMTLALSGLAVILLSLMHKKYSFAIAYFFFMVFANSRSSPSSIKQTDYQVSVYIVMMLASGAYCISMIHNYLKKTKIFDGVFWISGILLVVLSTYYLFTTLDMGYQFMHKFYPKYMGTMPLIYDRPEAAPVLNKFIKPDEYVYIGPFDFEELFYLHTKKQPSKYHWFLQHAASSKIKDELVADLEKNKPIVIVFNRGYAPWGGEAKTFNYFIQDILDRDYFRIYELNEGWKWKTPRGAFIDFDGTFHFDKSRKDEILKRLNEAGIIEKNY